MDLTVHSTDLKIAGPQCQALASDLKQLIRGKLPMNWVLIDSSDHTVVARRISPTSAYYKEFLSRSILEGLKGTFRGTRCDRARAQSRLLAELGFRSPADLCWGHCGRREFLITEGVAGQAAAKYIYEHWKRPLSRDQLRQQRITVRAVGREIGRLHRAGIVHGDLRLNNILVDPTHDEPLFYFIDNERNRRFKRIPMHLVRKNLVQVNMVLPTAVTNTDRLRFFKAYNQVYGRFSIRQQCSLARQVQRQAIKRLRGKSYL